jgi:hypothetical protein
MSPAAGTLRVSNAGTPGLLRGLDDFDRTSLREGAAALALWPKNADRHFALQALVEALGSEPETSGRVEIGAAEWAAWLAGEDGKALQEIQPDGFHDAPTAVEATVLGTRQGLLAGRLEFPALHYRLWMEALAGGDDPHLLAARELLTAATSLCNRVVEIAQLGSCKWPEHERPCPIGVPPEEEFERLRAALRIEFDDPEVARIFEPLQRVRGASPWCPLSRESESMLLIADPWQLSLSALVRSVNLAARSPQLATVLTDVRRQALAVVADAVSEMEWTVESVEEDHLVARADVDCRVVIGVGVITPDPAQLAAEGLSGDADLVAWHQRIASRAHFLGASHSLLAVVGDGRAVIADDSSLHATGESDPWLVGLGELQTIGEALRRDPLALPVALGSIARPPWPENFDLLDWVGMLRQKEEAKVEKQDRPLDGTEYMLMRGRVMAARHPALAPGLAGWIEVTRWEGVEDPAIYCSRERDDFALLVRGSGRYLWITCPGTLEQRYDLLPVVATALAFWSARLLEAGFLTPPAAVTDPIYVGFRLELDRRPGPQLAIAEDEHDTRIILGPGFLEALCQGNNDSDRMLVAAVLSWAKGLIEGDMGSVLDEIVPEGRGTIAIWPHPEATSNPPRLDPLPPVESRFRQEVERGLASSRVGEGEVLVASEEQLAPVLEDLARVLEAAIQDCLDSLEPAALCALVALHERAVHQSSMDAILLPARSVMRFAETYPDHTDEIFVRDLTLRILIERCSALPPQGSEPCGRRTGAELRAATELQLELRGALDAVLWEQAGGRVAMSSELGIRVDLGGELPGASQAMRDQVVTAAPDLMAAVHSDWWGERPELGSPPALDEPIGLEGDWAEVDLAMAQEWGVGLEQMVRLLHALAAIADEQPDCVGCLATNRLGPELVRRTAISAAAVTGAVERLTLSPCPEYDAFSEEHQPGRANRERSYMRRPLVALPDDWLCWSNLHCKRAAEYLGALIESGRLCASGTLAGAVTRISQGLDRDFEDAVLAAVHDCGWRGEARLEQLGGVPLRRRRSEKIGDVDVLAWSPERREVWLLDAKRLNPGVEPGPMLREGLTFEKHVEHHGERLRWVRDHLPQLAREIGVEATEDWEIRAALVLDRPLTGAHLGQISMPIWTFWALPRELSGEGASAAAASSWR